MKKEHQELLNEIFLGKEDPDMAFKKPMTNNLKEEIHKAIKTAYELALASNDSDQKKGIDNFYHIHLNPLEYQIDTWLRNLINQKEKEARIDELEKISGFSNATGVATVASGELGNLRNRIKQLKEELKEEVL